MNERIELLEAIIATQEALIAKKDEIIELKNETIQILRAKLCDVLGVDLNA